MTLSSRPSSAASPAKTCGWPRNTGSPPICRLRNLPRTSTSSPTLTDEVTRLIVEYSDRAAFRDHLSHLIRSVGFSSTGSATNSHGPRCFKLRWRPASRRRWRVGGEPDHRLQTLMVLAAKCSVCHPASSATRAAVPGRLSVAAAANQSDRLHRPASRRSSSPALLGSGDAVIGINPAT